MAPVLPSCWLLPSLSVPKAWHVEKDVAPNVGLEPTTLRLRVSCSTDWASRACGKEILFWDLSHTNCAMIIGGQNICIKEKSTMLVMLPPKCNTSKPRTVYESYWSPHATFRTYTISNHNYANSALLFGLGVSTKLTFEHSDFNICNHLHVLVNKFYMGH